MITTDRLVLQPVSSDDSEALMAVFGDEEVMQFSDDGPQDSEFVKDWIAKMEQQAETTGHEVMVLKDRETNEVLGYCGLFDLEIDGQPEVEVGYRLRRDAWGKGLATQAVNAVLQHAHDDLKLERVVAMIDPSNEASAKVAKKAGMVHEKDIMMPGYDHPDQLFVSESP